MVGIRRGWIYIAAVRDSIGCPSCGVDRTRRQPAPTPCRAKINPYVNPYVEDKNFSGSILIAKAGKVLFSKSYGMANYELAVPNRRPDLLPSYAG